MTLISSEQNPQIKQAAALARKKERDASGLILVEGRHPVEEALKAGLRLVHLYYPEEAPAPLDLSPAAVPVSTRAMAKMATTDSPPPVLAVFEKPEPVSLQEKAADLSLVLALDSLQDPGNLGTLIRSAVAFGASGIVLTGSSTDPYSPKVIRASAGLVFHLPVFETSGDELPETLGEFQVFAAMPAHAPAVRHYKAVDYRERCVLLLGSEGQGLSDALLDWPGLQRVTIPTAMAVESLNVAVSGSILLAEAAAQRSGEPHA